MPAPRLWAKLGGDGQDGVKTERPKSRHRWMLRLMGLALVAAFVVLRLADPYPVRELRLTYFDYLQRLSPRAYSDDLPVRVLDIDEASLAELGQWPWPRTRVADLVDRLFELGAATVAFDMLFAEPDRYSPSSLARDPAFSGLLGDLGNAPEYDNDVQLARAIEGHPVVLGVAARNGPLEGSPAPKAGVAAFGEAPASGLVPVAALTPLAPPLGVSAAGIGDINVAPGTDTGVVVRQVPLIWNGATGLLPTLSVEALRLATGTSTLFLDERPGAPGIVDAVEIGPIRVPTTPDGKIWVHFRPENPGLYISARDVLATDGDDDALRAAIAGRIILVGTSAAGLLDIRETALGQSVPGVSIHAQIIEQIVDGDVIRRSDVTAGLELLAFIGLGVLMTGAMSIFGPSLSIAFGTFAGLIVLATGLIVFRTTGTLFDATFPLVGGMLNFAIMAGYQFIVTDRDKRMIRRSFAHYVAPELLQRIEADGTNLRLGGGTQVVTVMFSDIRNFTPMTETMSANELVAILNELFTTLGSEILAERGTIDKFIGDAIMAFWNAPLEVEDHALHAALAALRMRTALARFNATPIMEGHDPVALAIGCATGEACVGNIGSRERFNYTVIGDVVNVTARIETSCRRVAYDIVVANAVVAEAGGRLATLEAGFVELKGKSTREKIHVVVGDAEMARSDSFAALARAHLAMLAALRGHDPQAFARALATCRTLAAEVEPGLGAFFDAIPGRAEDFRAVVPGPGET